jgi:hypothetical protein
MFLQLHGHQQLASRNFPNVPDLILPEAFKVSKREIIEAAINDAVDIVTEEVNKAIKKRNEQSLKKSLPSLDSKGLEEIQLVIEEIELEDIPEEEEELDFVPLGQKRQMGAWYTALLKVGKFLLVYGKQIYDFAQRAVRTINLVKVNNQIQEYYDTNQFGFRNLNELNKEQIDQQINLLSGEFINAKAANKKVEMVALGRLIQGYNQRKISLPAISQRTLLIAGGVLAAYLLFRK